MRRSSRGATRCRCACSALAARPPRPLPTKLISPRSLATLAALKLAHPRLTLAARLATRHTHTDHLDLGSPRSQLTSISPRCHPQSEIDAWHARNPAPFDAAEYSSFLHAIGYLTPDATGSFELRTSAVDDEIATLAGPQALVRVRVRARARVKIRVSLTLTLTP